MAPSCQSVERCQRQRVALAGALRLIMLITSLQLAAQGVPVTEIIVDPKQPDTCHTIQAALDQAGPGAVITVAGGLYREHLVTRRDGAPGRPITIRAAANQVVLVSPGVPLGGQPEAVPGEPDLFCWPAAGVGTAVSDDSLALWEGATRLRLTRVNSREECARRFASWYYEQEDDRLYIRSSGATPSASLSYICEEGKHPVLTVEHSHLIVEGLTCAFGAHGIHIRKGDSVTIRNCHAYCNRSAGIHAQGAHHRIVGNVVDHNNQYGIQLRYAVYHTEVRHNLAFFNGPNNGSYTDNSVPADISLYSRSAYNLFEGNVVEGLHQNAMRNKYGGNISNLCRDNVIKGFFDWAAPCIVHNTVIASDLGPRFGIYLNRVVPDPEPDPERVDPGGMQRRTNLLHPVIHKDEPHFVDPVWRDYRLQADSPYHGLGAASSDERFIFVDPLHGADSNHGRSCKAALRTLSRAALMLHPGHTLYLMPGHYREPLRLVTGSCNGDEPIRIRAHGQSWQAVLAGGLTIEQAGQDEVTGVHNEPFAKTPPQWIVVEGVIFHQQGVTLRRAANIRFLHCIWDGVASPLLVEECREIAIDRATLCNSGTTVIRESGSTTISRSLFAGDRATLTADAASLPTLQSYFNAWHTPRWQVGTELITSLAAWQELLPRQCGDRVEPVVLGADYLLPSDSPLVIAADDHGPVGARGAPDDARVDISGLRVAGATPTSVTLLWQTSRGATQSQVLLCCPDGSKRQLQAVDTFQIFGSSFDMSFRSGAFFMAERHLTLDELQPDSEYEVRVTATPLTGRVSGSASLKFKTPKQLPSGRLFFVAPQGNDQADGMTAESAWRSLQRAAAVAGPGDCVKVLPGVYRETLRPRISGVAGAPVRFESVEPRRAVIDLQESLPAAAEILNVNHVEIVGFALTNGKYQQGHAFVVANGRNNRIAGCEMRYPAGASFDKPRLGHAGLVATDAPGLVVEDNLFLCCQYSIGLSRATGARIEHNTIVGGGNGGFSLIAASESENYTIRNNLFDRPAADYKRCAAIWLFDRRPGLTSNHNLFHIPDGYKGPVGTLVTNYYDTLAQWQAATGEDDKSLEAKPLFVDPEAGDFRLRSDSPGYNGASEGGPIGLRW